MDGEGLAEGASLFGGKKRELPAAVEGRLVPLAHEREINTGYASYNSLVADGGDWQRPTSSQLSLIARLWLVLAELDILEASLTMVRRQHATYV